MWKRSAGATSGTRDNSGRWKRLEQQTLRYKVGIAVDVCRGAGRGS